MPDLTVMMSAWHASATVTSAVRSTLRAMPRDAELVVVVDGPDEATARAVDTVKDRRLKLEVGTENRGTAARHRQIVEMTDSRLVANMDADDLSLPWRFRITAPKPGTADAVFGAAVRFGTETTIGPAGLHRLRPEETAIVLAFGNPLFHSSMVARREAVEKAGNYAESIAEDYELWLRLVIHGYRIAKTAVPVIAYRYSPDQLTRTDAFQSNRWSDALLQDTYAAYLRAVGLEDLLDGGGTFRRPRLSSARRDALLARLGSDRKRDYFRRQMEARADVVTD